ncbi:hypothetical protein WA026_011324, partial [Henosepilachna vigintioctopunctata]
SSSFPKYLLDWKKYFIPSKRSWDESDKNSGRFYRKHIPFTEGIKVTPRSHIL